MQTLHPAYGERLREAMVSAGVLPADVADVADVSVAQTHEILEGTSRPSPPARARLERALDVTLAVDVCAGCGAHGPEADLREGTWAVGGCVCYDTVCGGCRWEGE
jgi:transcriptional regulator with XRE-family HTH domain